MKGLRALLVACPAWGSLHWKLDVLPLAAPWRRRGPRPGADEAVACLDHPQGEVRRPAEAYVRRVPPDIRTPYGDVIEARASAGRRGRAVGAERAAR